MIVEKGTILTWRPDVRSNLPIYKFDEKHPHAYPSYTQQMFPTFKNDTFVVVDRVKIETLAELHDVGIWAINLRCGHLVCIYMSEVNILV